MNKKILKWDIKVYTIDQSTKQFKVYFYFITHFILLLCQCRHNSQRSLALKDMFARFQWTIDIFEHPLVSQMLHPIDINVPRSPPTRNVFSISDLQALIRASLQHPFGLVLRPLFLLAFFGFLHISNLFPSSAFHFDPHSTPGRMCLSCLIMPFSLYVGPSPGKVVPTSHTYKFLCCLILPCGSPQASLFFSSLPISSSFFLVC